MNRIYKLKFNQTLQQVQVVSELANQTVAHTTVTSTDSSCTHRILYSLTTKLHSALSTIIKSSMIMTSLVGFGWSLHSQASATTNPQVSHIVGTHGQMGSVVAGTATAVTDGLVTTINNSPNAIINWQSFNINQNELLKFVQQSTDSAVLNRVVGSDVSKILGSLQSNGKVFVINPNGIIFGQNSHVNVGGLVASTLEINNKDFLDKHYVFNQAKDHKLAQVLSAGMIKVNANGSLALIGGQVLNNGVLEARQGTVFLLAGQTIEIADLHNPQISYKVTAQNKAVNLGQIFAQNAMLLGNKVLNGQPSVYAQNSFADLMGSADQSHPSAHINAQGEVVLFGGSTSDQLQSSLQTDAQVLGNRNAIVINNGTINVSNVRGKAGKVQVLGDLVSLESHSQIQATGQQGGEVILGGDATGRGKIKVSQLAYFDQGQTVNVSASTVEGNAGHIVVWSDRTQVNGNFIATSEQGSGGFIETSGHAIGFSDDLHINTSAAKDKSGLWLIDPEYFAVVGSENDLDQFKNKKIGKSDVIFPTDEYVYSKDVDYKLVAYDDNVGRFNKAPAHSYVTTQRIKELVKGDKEARVQFVANHGLIFYNVTIDDSFDHNFTQIVLQTSDFKAPTHNNAILIKKVNLTKPGLELEVQGNPYNGDYDFVTTLTMTDVTTKNLGSFYATGIHEGYVDDVHIHGNGFGYQFSDSINTTNSTFDLSGYLYASNGSYNFSNITVNFTTPYDGFKNHIVGLSAESAITRNYKNRKDYNVHYYEYVNITNSTFKSDQEIEFTAYYANVSNTSFTAKNNITVTSGELNVTNQSKIISETGVVKTPRNINDKESYAFEELDGDSVIYEVPFSENFSFHDSQISGNSVALNTHANLNFTNTNVTAKQTTLLRSANVSISGANISGDTGLNISSNIGLINITKTNLTSNQGTFNISAPGIDVNNSKINADKFNIAQAAFNEEAIYHNDKPEARKRLPEYKIYQATDKTIKFNNNNLTTKKSLDITTDKPIDLTGNTFTVTNSDASININSKDNVTLTSTFITAPSDVNINSGKAINIKGTSDKRSAITSSAGAVNIISKSTTDDMFNVDDSTNSHENDISIAHVDINGKTAVKVSSDKGVYSIDDSKLSSHFGKLDLSSSRSGNKVSSTTVDVQTCSKIMLPESGNIHLNSITYQNCNKDNSERPTNEKSPEPEHKTNPVVEKPHQENPTQPVQPKPEQPKPKPEPAKPKPKPDHPVQPKPKPKPVQPEPKPNPDQTKPKPDHKPQPSDPQPQPQPSQPKPKPQPPVTTQPVTVNNGNSNRGSSRGGHFPWWVLLLIL